MLITVQEFRDFGREVAKTIQDSKILKYIEEAELLDIKKALGDPLYIDIYDKLLIRTFDETFDETFADSPYGVLLNGGNYTYCGEKYKFQGLKKTLVYYSYARFVKNSDTNVTRFGFTQKENEFSSHPDFKSKMTQYNDAFAIADSYLDECLTYLERNIESFPLYKNRGIKSNRTIFKIIGE